MYNLKSITNVDNFGFLTHLNTEELKSVLNDESKIEEMVKDVKQCKDMEKDKEMLLVSNRSLAEFNLNKEPLLMVSKKQLMELSEECDNLYKSIETYKGRESNLETKLSFLQMATQEMEEESEAIAESFLEGSTEIEDFLEKFMQRRKIMHLRKVKADKMKEIITEQLNLSNRISSPPYPSSGGSHFYRPQIPNLNGAMRPMY